MPAATSRRPASPSRRSPARGEGGPPLKGVPPDPGAEPVEAPPPVVEAGDEEGETVGVGEGEGGVAEKVRTT